MSHFFGLHRGHLLKKADTIAKCHGGRHVNFTEPNGEERGWFECQNRGNPFDQWTADKVLAAIEELGGFEAFRRKSHFKTEQGTGK